MMPAARARVRVTRKRAEQPVRPAKVRIRRPANGSPPRSLRRTLEASGFRSSGAAARYTARHRGDTMLVIVKERPPPLALIMVRISLREISRDGGQTDGDPKLRELGPNLSGAPAILICESANEHLHLSRNRRPSGSALRDRSPVEPETLAVPADDGFGLNDDQDLFPPGPHS